MVTRVVTVRRQPEQRQLLADGGSEMADAEHGLFDSVLMIDAARLARDLKLYAELDTHLSKLGVAVHWPHSLTAAAAEQRR